MTWHPGASREAANARKKLEIALAKLGKNHYPPVDVLVWAEAFAEEAAVHIREARHYLTSKPDP